FVKYGQYSPQMNEKSGSASLALATVAILGQPPSISPTSRRKAPNIDFLRYDHLQDLGYNPTLWIK
ncbi:MAG: hypothetical protein ABFS45_16290, partial [Pseudomonadota bacterium]